MHDEFQDTGVPSENAWEESGGRWWPLLGSILLIAATGLVFVASISGPAPAPFELPLGRGLWFLGAMILGLTGTLLLRQPREARDPTWQPSAPGRRFDSVLLYSRDDCHLCHLALETLLEHREFLPPIEEIDIDSDAELSERFGTLIPVIEIDGIERFHGQINVLLLRRLIDATPPRPTTA